MRLANIILLFSVSAILLLTIGLVSAQASFDPTITVVNPQEGDVVSGKMIVGVEVNNVDIEAHHYGASVRLILDDKSFKGKGQAKSFEDRKTTYEWQVSTRSIGDGEHVMMAQACHSGGWVCYFSDPITFTVSNGK